MFREALYLNVLIQFTVGARPRFQPFPLDVIPELQMPLNICLYPPPLPIVAGITDSIESGHITRLNHLQIKTIPCKRIQSGIFDK